MWKLGRSRVLLDEPPEEEDSLRGGGAAFHRPRRRSGIVAKSRTRLSDFTFTFYFHALKKEMATHSSVLAWRIPGMGQPSGLPPSMGSHSQTRLKQLSSSSSSIVPGASFRGWKEVTSLFNKDDEQQLLEGRKSPKSRATNLRLKEELKTEKKSGFWDNLVLKQNIQSKKPDEIEGWEPPKLALEDVAADSGGPVSDRASRPGWQEDTKGSSKYTSLAGAGSSSRWSLRSAGKLVSIRRQSRGHLTDDWEELE